MRKFLIIFILLLPSLLFAQDGFNIYEALEKYSQFIYARYDFANKIPEDNFHATSGKSVNGTLLLEKDHIDTLSFPNNPYSANNDGWGIVKLDRRYRYPYYPAGDIIDYCVAIRAKIDTIGTLNDTIAFADMILDFGDNRPPLTRPLGAFTADRFYDSDPYSILILWFSLDELYRADILSDSSFLILSDPMRADVVIRTTGKRNLAINYIKLYDETGHNLVETDIFAAELSANLPGTRLGEAVEQAYVPGPEYPLSNALLTGRAGYFLAQYKAGVIRKFKSSAAPFPPQY